MPITKSKGEADLDKALAEVFGPAAVTPEMPIKVFGKTLYVDRVLRGYKLAFEVDGLQHDKFSAFYHRDADGFKSAKERDTYKSHWLESQGYTVIRFKHDETITPGLVRQKVRDALESQGGP